MSNFDDDLDLAQKREQAEKLRLLQSLTDAKDLETLLELPEGRRFFRRLLAQCGLGRISYTPNDSYHTAFLEGQRNVGLWVEDLLQSQPALYLQLLTEKYHERISDNVGN